MDTGVRYNTLGTAFARNDRLADLFDGKSHSLTATASKLRIPDRLKYSSTGQRWLRTERNGRKKLVGAGE
ncbi:unnamed protein product [Nippostrongylus brasiliensis]|uniref:TonB_dep_Rec domain-containing protein n=1 Tax=Nippostrongylus brasiliensis TaxID=27835 RepID=A0A0N4XJ57_NIPBR|nr:unnamed protein product [Nippostrongylus brasiliensis]